MRKHRQPRHLNKKKNRQPQTTPTQPQTKKTTCMTTPKMIKFSSIAKLRDTYDLKRDINYKLILSHYNTPKAISPTHLSSPS